MCSVCPPFSRTPYNDTIHYRSGDDRILIVDENNRTNVCESTEKLTSERKSLEKQQILMYKTAVNRL